jgi:hypothetical protein
LRDHVAQRALETFQFINLPMDVSNALFRDSLHLRASTALSGEPEQHANFAERETQFTSPAHEQQALLIFFGVEPVPARVAGRLRQNTNAFVERMVSIFTSVRSDTAPMVTNRFVSMVPTCDA